MNNSSNMVRNLIIALILVIAAGVVGYFIGKGALVKGGASVYNTAALRAIKDPNISSTGPTGGEPGPGASLTLGDPCTGELSGGRSFTGTMTEDGCTPNSVANNNTAGPVKKEGDPCRYATNGVVYYGKETAKGSCKKNLSGVTSKNIAPSTTVKLVPTKTQ